MTPFGYRNALYFYSATSNTFGGKSTVGAPEGRWQHSAVLDPSHLLPNIAIEGLGIILLRFFLYGPCRIILYEPQKPILIIEAPIFGSRDVVIFVFRRLGDSVFTFLKSHSAIQALLK